MGFVCVLRELGISGFGFELVILLLSFEEKWEAGCGLNIGRVLSNQRKKRGGLGKDQGRVEEGESWEVWCGNKRSN